MTPGKPPIDYDRVFQSGQYEGMTVREMLLASYSVEPDGCWRWTRSITNKGYGQFGYTGVVNGKRMTLQYQSHRAFAEMFGLDISQGLVLHSCDHPYCVNPAHIRIGTLQDNMDDKVARGRVFRPVGDAHPQAKLTASDVLDIRRRAQTEPYAALAAEYNTRVNSIGRIVNGGRWKHLPLHP